MLQAVSALKGFSLEATDGALGTVSDFLFDDSTWKVRWLAVDTGRWLTGRKVLVHPSAIGEADRGSRRLPVALTKAQVEGSPDVAEDKPVSQQMQSELYGYYGWDPMWGGGVYGAGMYGGGLYGGTLGGLALPMAMHPDHGANGVAEANRTHDKDGDPHLRSLAEVTGYHVHATDGSIGHVEDVLIESAAWGIRYLVVDTSNWWFGKHILLSPHAVKELDWSDRHIRVDLSRDKVRSSPSWSPGDAMDGDFERRLHGHYDWPSYAS